MRPGHADLAHLLSRVADGDRDAFAQLYRATTVKLFSVVHRILRRQELAEDILQDVYVRIWQRAASYDADLAAPMTWLCTIARNRALDEARRHEPLAVAVPVDTVEIVDPARPATDTVVVNEELRRLAQCLEQLEERRGTAIRLAYIEGLSRQDLADRFGLPVGTIKTWLHRGLKQLKDCLDG